MITTLITCQKGGHTAWTMTDKFGEQLPRRIVTAHLDPAQENFALYVRLVREKLKLDREALAKRANVDRDTLVFIENHLLLPSELTEEVRQKIEQSLGISYRRFMQLNSSIVEELRPDWSCHRLVTQNTTDRKI